MTLRSALEQYLSMRQGLGYKYQQQARRLAAFVSFMERNNAATITTKLAVAWATLPADRHSSCALRLTDVRGFARHVANIDPQTEVPLAGILPPLKRAKPYIYTDAEINAQLTAALTLPPPNGLRRWTYHYLFGLFAVTGIRLSEAMRLRASLRLVEQKHALSTRPRNILRPLDPIVELREIPIRKPQGPNRWIL
ncbi:site-specific integrase [Mesorhizobium tianshanense]|nr:hypothetical protein [Mesorhizobium tianshanense]